ncbi:MULTISPECIES: hypothetical protein [unclassified Rhodococcus (in: high G+C Gram-positive bacteria)]|uniref:hypothetical protein n=1 Tax=unclassified Rhodococcus (in: high G+C Gram-positive bacteria) TaxID=192944 RepID=UPI002078F74B|nr:MULTISPECIES: hypothetical protein [unclassified Rhodococcus (in: high G+C Gram-positive bacteria)]
MTAPAAPCETPTTSDGWPSADTPERPARRSSRLPTVSIVLGALSIPSFWVFGLGFVLGLCAVVCGAFATTRTAVADDEAASLRALLGIVAGVAGIMVSAIALFPILEYL